MVNEVLKTTDKVMVGLIKGAPKSAWVSDIAEMHSKFSVNPIVESLTKEQLSEYMQFRIGCLQEELDELKDAKTADDAVDALLDLIVFATGTLDVFKVDADKGWKRIHDANMSKEPGIKPERPNKYGFPDLIKPTGWQAPTHHDNVGLFSKIY